MSIDLFLKNLWRWKCNIQEQETRRVDDLTTLRLTQWSPRLEELARNRLIMGTFRYGDIRKQDYSKYNLPAEAKRRLDRYVASGTAGNRNLEHLVDAWNIVLLAFVHGETLGEKVTAQDDGLHTPEAV